MFEAQQEETTYVENIFGLVTDKRVVYHPNRGWLTEGGEEEASLSGIASVEFAISRNLSAGILLIFLGVPAILVLVGVIFILFGYCLLKGTPTVIVSTTDGKREVMKGWPWQRGQAEEFVRALQGRIAPGQEVRIGHASSSMFGASRHLVSGPVLTVIVIALFVVVFCAIAWLVMLFGLSPF